jgi:hypothetical protein
LIINFIENIGREEIMSVFLSSYHFHNYKKSTATNPPHSEVKGEGMISCDTSKPKHSKKLGINNRIRAFHNDTIPLTLFMFYLSQDL